MFLSQRTMQLRKREIYMQVIENSHLFMQKDTQEYHKKQRHILPAYIYVYS